MLVSEYASNLIDNRPLKYGTRQSYFKIIRSLGIWDLEVEYLNCALIYDKVDSMRSHNVKKNVYICFRSVFRDLGIFNDLPIMQGISKVYDFPTPRLRTTIDAAELAAIMLFSILCETKYSATKAATKESPAPDVSLISALPTR